MLFATAADRNFMNLKIGKRVTLGERDPIMSKSDHLW
jgi:hypothetical protein